MIWFHVQKQFFMKLRSKLSYFEYFLPKLRLESRHIENISASISWKPGVRCPTGYDYLNHSWFSLQYLEKNVRIIAEIGYHPFLLILFQFFVSLRAGWSEDRIPEEVNCLHLSSPALRSIQPRIQWYRLIRGGKVAGVWRWSSTPIQHWG
jgi:hypothetical protein